MQGGGDMRKRKKGDECVGEVLNFRGMSNAPVNEMGVVSLFSAMAVELGYRIEGFRFRYPDCETRRLICEHRKLWTRCMVEFEFRSSNFVAHGHDAGACDLVVCWRHDWEDPAVEVLELREAVDGIRSGSLIRDGRVRGYYPAVRKAV
jgi:hypothetical protein